jgi:hypothetical protein
MTDEVFAFDPKRVNNAQAILDAAKLGYLRETDFILDATYGKGRFWKLWRPNRVLANDLYERSPEIDTHEDYRALSSRPGVYGVTVFDPPYKLNGTGGSHPSDEGYGVATPYQNIDDMITGIALGFAECVRVTKTGGYILNKTQAQVVSGRKRWLDLETAVWARDLDCRLVDQLYVYGYRRQPEGRRQVHARSNVSVLQIYRKER